MRSHTLSSRRDFISSSYAVSHCGASGLEKASLYEIGSSSLLRLHHSSSSKVKWTKPSGACVSELTFACPCTPAPSGEGIFVVVDSALRSCMYALGIAPRMLPDKLAMCTDLRGAGFNCEGAVSSDVYWTHIG